MRESNITYNYLNLPTEIYQNDNVLNYYYRADGVKVKKIFTLNNEEGTTVVNTEYLDGFQYSTPNTEPIRRALEVTDEPTVMAATAGEEEAFLPSDKLVVVDPSGAGLDNVILSFFPTAEGLLRLREFSLYLPVQGPPWQYKGKLCKKS